MLNQGRPLLRVERSGARTGKGGGREWDAPGPGIRGKGWQDGRSVVCVGVFIDGCRARGVVSLPGR